MLDWTKRKPAVFILLCHGGTKAREKLFEQFFLGLFFILLENETQFSKSSSFHLLFLLSKLLEQGLTVHLLLGIFADSYYLK